MPFPLLAAAVPSIASFIGGLFGHKQSQTPTVGAAYQPLQQMLIQQAMARLQQPLPSGYEAGGISQINQGYNATNLARENALTARGLAGSPIAAASDTTAGIARAGDITRFQQQVPLIQQSLQDQALRQGAGVLGFGTGQTGTSGGGIEGGISGLAQMLGWLYGSGKLGAGGAPPVPPYPA